MPDNKYVSNEIIFPKTLFGKVYLLKPLISGFIRFLGRFQAVYPILQARPWDGSARGDPSKGYFDVFSELERRTVPEDGRAVRRFRPPVGAAWPPF